MRDPRTQGGLNPQVDDAIVGIRFNRPSDNGGSPITSFVVQRDDGIGGSFGSDASMDTLEVQEIQIASTYVGSSNFSLALRGAYSGPIPAGGDARLLDADAGAALMQEALEASTGGSFGITKISFDPAHPKWAITFVAAATDMENHAFSGT